MGARPALQTILLREDDVVCVSCCAATPAPRLVLLLSSCAADAGVCFVMTLSLPSHYLYLLCYSVLSGGAERRREPIDWPLCNTSAGP